MHLTCPDCGAAVPAQDINIDKGLAKCSACGALIDVEKALGRTQPQPSVVARPPVPQPSTITVEDLGNGVRITRRWFTWAAVILTFFCVFWVGFLIFWYSMALRPGMPVMMVLFPLIHVTVGVVLTYFTIAFYINCSIL